MTKPITDTIRKSYEASAELFRSGRWAFGLAWRSHRFSLMGRILCAVLTGLVPAAFAMVIADWRRWARPPAAHQANLAPQRPHPPHQLHIGSMSQRSHHDPKKSAPEMNGDFPVPARH